MSLFSLLALTFGMVAAAVDRGPRPAFALIAVSGRRASLRSVEQRPAVEDDRRSRPPRAGRIVRSPVVRLLEPLRGASAARAPGFGR